MNEFHCSNEQLDLDATNHHCRLQNPSYSYQQDSVTLFPGHVECEIAMWSTRYLTLVELRGRVHAGLLRSSLPISTPHAGWAQVAYVDSDAIHRDLHAVVRYESKRRPLPAQHSPIHRLVALASQLSVPKV